MLKLDRVSKTLGSFAMKNVSLHIGKGDYFVIVGPSGAGKTVLLETIAGLHRASSGRIYLGDDDITDSNIQSRSVGLVYQDQTLFPHMTVRQNIEYGLRSRGTTKSKSRKLAADYAAKVGATELLGQMPQTLSGGEAQRIALARTLVTKPCCLLLDEPISALDATSRHEIQALLRNIHRQGQTIIHITHDYSEALTLATHVAVMENGQIQQTGTPQEVFDNPNSEFVSNFIGVKNFFKGQLNLNLSTFSINGIEFQTSDKTTSSNCAAIIDPNAIKISKEKTDVDDINRFEAKVIDIAKHHNGIEITVDVGIQLCIMSSHQVSLNFNFDDSVWVSVDPAKIRLTKGDLQC